MILQIQKNELDEKFILDMGMGIVSSIWGIVMFILSIYWDLVAKKFFLYHAEGLGAGQILLAGLFGIWFVLSMAYLKITMVYWKHYGK